MNKFFLIILFLTLFFNVNSQVCGTCTNADCGNMINKTGPTADVDLKAVLNYKFPTPPPSQAYKFDPDPLMGKSGPFTFSACYEIYVTSSSQTVGIAIKPIYSTPTSGGNLPFTGELKKLGQCSSAPITPNNTIPSVSSATESIPSITEWTNLPIGTYVYCINTSVPAGFNLKSVLLGSYVKGGTTTSNECSDCNTASCDIAGPYSDFATAVLGEKISDATDNHCSKKVSLSSSPVKTPNKYTSYYKVKTSSTATMLGIIISNGTGKLPGETNPCGVAVRTATLYPITGCTSSGVSGSTTSNITDFFNREWTGLTSGTEYIIKVETTAPSGCQIQDQCASYYTPGAITPLPCGTVGINWRNAANTPTQSDKDNCVDKDFELKANSVIFAQQDIAPGFLIDNDFGKINLTKIELDQGQTGNYINTNLVKDITFCSPNVGYNVRLTGSVISPGSGIIRIIDHATGQDLYVGPFTNGMVIPINAGTLKGTAIFSGPGVSNHRLNYPSAGATSYIAAGYGFFNPSKAGNGTHTISYSWNNGNQDCGTATIEVEVKGCSQPACSILSPTINSCNCNFTDSGGDVLKYSNNENKTTIICPDDATGTKKVKLTFSSLAIQDNNDHLKIFDGKTINDTKIFEPLSTTTLPTSAFMATNSTGCLTVQFTSDATGVAAGWAAQISCYTPCSQPVAKATTVEYDPTTNIKSCIGTTINFDGTTSTANATGGITTYSWDFGDGSAKATGAKVTHTYTSPGIFSPTLVVTNADGCSSTNAIPHVVNIASIPNFKGSTTGSVCLNNQVCIDGKVNFTPISKKVNISTPTITDIPTSAGITSIPITISGYTSGQKITSATDIQSVLINMEHSAISDLVITLLSPTGQSVVLYQQSASDAGGATVLGKPSMGGAALEGACTWSPSSATGTERGVGLDYFFKSSASQTMVDVDEKYNWSGTFPLRQTLPIPPCLQVPAGDYKPINPFSNLIGSDINGTWILQVKDNVNNDDGTVFNWKLNLNPSLLSGGSITPVVSLHKWTAVSGSDITSGAATSKLCVTPTSLSNTDYKYEITDDFGCKKDTTIKITINNSPTVSGTTTLCEGTSATDWTPASGVTWSSSDPTKASVANGGTLSGFKQGTVTITATANNCSATKTVTVNPIPAFTPSIIDICEGSDPSLSYTGLTGNPDRIVFNPGLPGVSPFNLTLTASTTSPITISNLPAKLSVNTYSGVKVRVENSVTGCKSSDITIAQFKVQATQKPSISSKSTSNNSVTFQWADLPGLQTQITGTSKDEYSIKEFVCSGCATAGTYVNATGTLTFNATSSRWEYVKNGLAPGSRVFIEVTPIDNAPLATPSCYSSSKLDLTAIQCDAPVITKDLDNNIILCEGTTTSPVSTTISLEYNSADLTTPATWEILTPGGSWTALSNTGVYSTTGSVNIDTKLTISNIKGLDGTKFRVNLKTPTVNGTCNTISNEVLLTVKPLPVMVPVADKSFCPGTLVNDPTKPKDFDLKITQSGTPTFNWSSDFQTTGVKLEGVNTNDGSKNVLDFESFTTSNPNNDAVSIITVTPTLNQCVGQPITFKITVKPTIKAAFAASDIDFNSVKFNWATSSVVPDFWVIDTLITGSTAATPSLSNYKSGGQQLGSVNTYSIIGINSSKKAYILVTPKQDPTKTELFCPVSIGFNGIPTPCVKPTKPLTPAITPICEGVALTINNVLADINANFQWKISTDAGTTWNNVSFSDFGNTGTTNVLSTQLTKAYMNKALVKVVVTDKQTGSCSEESNTATIVINELPNVKLIQPTSSSLCLDDNDVSAFIQPLSGKSPLKVDYTFNGVQKTNQDISNLEIKFSAKSVINYSLTVDKVIDANGCISSLTGLISQVAVHKNPTPNFAVSDTIGCYPLLINFTDISGEKYTNVTWDFGTGTNTSNDLGTTSFTYPKEGDYTVTYSVLDAFGCSGQIIKPNLIHVKSSPKAAITTDRNILSVYENVVKFDSKLSKNATFYQWDFGDNSPISNVPVVEHKYDPSVPGKFKISLIVSNSSTNMSCSDTAITWVDFPEEIVFFIPNTFTPNGDEFNNTFQPIFTSGYDPQNYSFIIFDRWGQIVFESNNPQVGWDGTYGDKILGNDTFVWKLGFKEKSSDNEHRSTGHVNLVK